MSTEIIDGKTFTLIPVSARTGVTGGRCYRQGFTYSVSERAAGVAEGENTNNGFGRTKHTFPIHTDNPGIYSSAGYPLSDCLTPRGLSLFLLRVSLAQRINYSATETSAVRITGKPDTPPLTRQGIIVYFICHVINCLSIHRLSGRNNKQKI